MSKILVVLGSVREGRVAESVSNIISEVLRDKGHEVVMADFKSMPLPFVNGGVPSDPSFSPQDENVRKWTQMVADADSVVIASPEYNHGIPAVLKNAIDWVYGPWENKNVTLVTYGWGGAPFTITHLNDVLGHLKANVSENTAQLFFMKDLQPDGQPIGESAKMTISGVLENL